MPNDPALASARNVPLRCALQERFDGGDLLIASNLLLRSVEKHIAAHEPHESFGATKADNRLFERSHKPVVIHQAIVTLHMGRKIDSHPFSFNGVERTIDDVHDELS